MIRRYTIPSFVPIQDVEETLVLSLLCVRILHDLDTANELCHRFDLRRRLVVIDARTVAGAALDKLFAGLLRREFGPESFFVHEGRRFDPGAFGRRRRAVA